MPDIKLVKGKETINRKNKQGDKGADNITLCELTELDSHENAEKSINTVIPTNIVHNVIKEEGIYKKSSEETINRLEIHSATGHTGQWTVPRKCTYPSEDGENSLNRLGGVEGCGVSACEGQHTGQWTVPNECRYPSDYSKKSFNRLEGVGDCKVSLYEGKGGYLQWTRKADSHEVQSDKSEKSLIQCDVMERNLHSVKVEWYVQRKDQLDKRVVLNYWSTNHC